METDGIVQLGEVPVVVRRESEHAADHTEAVKAARIEALREMEAFVTECEERTPRFEDTRPYRYLRTWIADRIRDAAA